MSNKGIFRAYDIRGVYPRELNEKLAEKIGAAFGSFIGGGTIAVGGDVRLSTPKLKESLIKGILSAGVNVMDIGIVSSSILSFAVASEKLNGGVMVTASHCKPEYNGFKFYGRGARPYSYEAGIGKIEYFVRRGGFKKGRGKLTEKNITEKYMRFMANKFSFKKSLKVVVDAGNGVAGLFVPEVFTRLGLKVEKLYCDPDGRFPNHLPDNTIEEAFNDLKKKVTETGADIGFFYDGDADRVSVVDERGNRVLDNHIFALLVKDLVKSSGEKVVYEVSCSDVVVDEIKKSGGIPVICRVGHTYIHEKMGMENAIFGGETSGHYFFKEMFSNDDALFASLRFVQILINSGKEVSELVNSLPKYYFKTIKVSKEDKFDFVEKLIKKFKSTGYKIIDIDGIKVLFDHGWVLVRASHTEPIVRVTWEGKTKEDFEKIGDFVKEEVLE